MIRMYIHDPNAAVPTTDPTAPFLLYEGNRNFLQDRTHKLYSPVEDVKTFMVVVALMNLILLLFLGGSSWRWWQFTTNGVITEAKVIAREIDDSGDSTTYFLTYTYNVRLADQARHWLTGRDRVNSHTYRQYEPGQYLTVRYLKADPTNVTSKWHRWWSWQLGAGYAAAILLLWFGCVSLPRYYRQRLQTILTQGKVVMGRLLTSTGKADDGGSKVAVCYDFTTPTGTMITGHSAEIRNDLQQKGLPATDAPVAVMYLAEKDFFLL